MNLKERLLEQLSRVQPFPEQMISFISAYPNCFERSLTIGHVTASAWLLDQTKRKALLLHHAKLRRWLQPGGHCDGNPDVLSVAIKEAQEESGIQGILPVTTEIFDVDIHTIPLRGDVPEHLHYDIRFLLYVATREEVSINRESTDWMWVDHALPPGCDLSVIRMFQKWRSIFPFQ